MHADFLLMSVINSLSACFKINKCSSFIFFQTIITQINHAIGASGVVSQECKSLVTEYGKTILDLLESKV